MRNWGMILLGAFLITLGLMSAISAIFDIDLGMVCWPLLLIFLGVLLLAGPRIGFPGESVKIRPLAGIRRRETWQVRDEEIWTFVGDLRLDFSQAEIPPGETSIRVLGFVGDVNLLIPEGVAYALVSTAFLNDAKIMGRKQQVFLGTLREQSAGYASAERKVRLEMFYFVNDLDVVAS